MVKSSQVLQHQLEDLGVMVMKWVLHTPEQEPHHQMQLSVLPRTFIFYSWRENTQAVSARDTACVFFTLLTEQCKNWVIQWLWGLNNWMLINMPLSNINLCLSFLYTILLIHLFPNYWQKIMKSACSFFLQMVKSYEVNICLHRQKIKSYLSIADIDEL